MSFLQTMHRQPTCLGSYSGLMHGSSSRGKVEMSTDMIYVEVVYDMHTPRYILVLWNLPSGNPNQTFLPGGLVVCSLLID